MPTQAIVLFAHGARDPEWAAPLRRVQSVVRELRPGVRIELAFLEFMAHSLPDCVDALVHDGVSEIVVVPMFIAQGGHLKRDVPRLIDELRGRHAGLELRLGEPIGEVAAVIRAMAAHIASLPAV